MDIDDYYESSDREHSCRVPTTYEASEDERVEMWNTNCFLGFEFSYEAVERLLSWKISPRDAEKLLFRDGVRTSCTHEQALRILQPA